MLVFAAAASNTHTNTQGEREKYSCRDEFGVYCTNGV